MAIQVKNAIESCLPLLVAKIEWNHAKKDRFVKRNVLTVNFYVHKCHRFSLFWYWLASSPDVWSSEPHTGGELSGVG